MRLIDADELPVVNTIERIENNDVFVANWIPAKLIENAPTVEAILVEWLKNKRDELEKEYYDLFHNYTDEGKNNQVWLLNDFHAFDTVLRYWEKENETNR